MTKMMLTDRPLHPQAPGVAAAFRGGRLSRREYLATMAALGVSAAGALALGGLGPTPLPGLPKPSAAASCGSP